MRLNVDFEMLVLLAVMNEMAERSQADSTDPEDEIVATPVTHHHFGGACFFNRIHRRFAWVRTYRERTGEKHDKTIADRIVVCFGYAEKPDIWVGEYLRNDMKHTHVSHETESHKIAAQLVIDFILHNQLPEQLFAGDYHFHEPALN